MYEDQLNGEFIWGHWGLKGEGFSWRMTMLGPLPIAKQEN